MLLSVLLSILLVCPSNQNEYDFESFYRMVEESLERSREYEPPTDNSGMATVVDNTTYDYGKFDFVIVGAGAAGSVLANRLSEIKKWKILLLEAGGEQNDFSNIPGYTTSLWNSEMDWGYRTTPQEFGCRSTMNFTCPGTRGKVLGGSTVLNSKMWVRGNREDFDTWARLGNTDWAYEKVLPYFKKTEHSHIPDGDRGYRGTRGPLDVSYFDDTFTTGMYLKAMQELNHSVIDYNGRDQIGAAKVQSSLRGNIAISGNRAFIDPIRYRRRNLNVTTRALVTRVLIDNSTKTAYGVEFIKNGRIFNVRASKEVVLSAGAINTPQILILSGIGPKEELEKLQIEPIVDLPVGKNLQDHILTMRLVFHTNRSIFNTSTEVYLRKYLKNHRPLTSTSNVDTTAFVNVKDPYNMSAQPNIQYINIVAPGMNFSTAVYNTREDTRADFLKNYNPYTDIIMFVALLHPNSRGAVTLKSNSIVDFPNIDYRYLTDPEGEDIETMYRGVLHALKLLETDAFKTYNVSVINVAEYCGKLDTSREYWYCNIRNLGTTIYHPVGTTTMGINRADSVVTPELLVHGMGKLRVADAGVMPTLTSGNTQAPVYMIGEKASDLIKGTHLRNGVCLKSNFFCDRQANVFNEYNLEKLKAQHFY